MENLSDDEKRRIRQEELFRSDIRKELAPAPAAVQPTSRIWTVINSSFGLWLLSAVFVSGAGTIYTNHQNEVRERREQAETERSEHKQEEDLVARLDLEISYRLSAAMAKLEALSGTNGSWRSDAHWSATLGALKPLSLPADGEHPPLFPEFKHYNGLALIAERRRHSPAGEQEQLRNQLTRVSFLINSVLSSSSATCPPPRDIAGDLIDAMRNDRWDNGFPYTDCTKAEPFC